MTSTRRLTPKQRRLIDDLRQIRDLLNLDFERILEVSPASRTVALEVMRNKIVRGQIIVWYTIIDEFLANRICRFHFGRQKSSQQLWRTKRFRLFNYHVIEQLSLLEKLRYVKAISALPKGCVADIERLNSLRNGLAHAFFPENLKSLKPEWKGETVFSFGGLERLKADITKVFDVFVNDEEWY